MGGHALSRRSLCCTNVVSWVHPSGSLRRIREYTLHARYVFNLIMIELHPEFMPYTSMLAEELEARGTSARWPVIEAEGGSRRPPMILARNSFRCYGTTSEDVSDPVIT